MKSKSPYIHVLTTGGTIDGIDGQPEPGKSSIICRYIEKAIHPHFQIAESVLCFKDSRNITDDDREKMLAVISSSPHNLFLITHGSFTMAESAEYLHSRIAKLSGQTIVFVGSFIPLGGADSDAPFNLGFALAALMFLTAGIYVAMNGEIFLAGTVAKNAEQLRFVHK